MMEPEEMVRAGGSLSASRPRNRGHVDRFSGGRVCAFDGCATVLSFYNPADRCWTHTEPRPKVALGRRPQEHDGPRVLSETEEQGLVRSLLLAKEARVHPARHPEPGPEPMPGPPPPPQPKPQPVPMPMG